MAGHETILETPRHIVKKEMVLPPGSAPARPAEILPPTQEQALATDEYFAQAADPETQAVASLMGLWTGTLLLRDLAVEHLRGPVKEEEDEPKRLPKLPDERDE